ncbi:MAG: glycolate oxidase subunit GlcE [Gammaproteobacteria bacterium]|nr:glycolate oxidase subunit GlcE [Gammaproteobacteria bacterium]
MPSLSSEIVNQVQTAYRAKTALNIGGAGTKSFLGQQAEDSHSLDVTGHHGIIEYDPAELVLVARAGTPLREIENILDAHDQMLGFEPPFADSGATLGGAVASGLAGPRRAYSGAVRDFVLGAGFVNGKGEIITAGGKVIKNVAGFDLFRPMAGAMGTLGVLLKVALRVMPKPEIEQTLVLDESDELKALKKMNLWAGKTQAISAAAWDGMNIRVRLSGSSASIAHGYALIGGEKLPNGNYWRDFNNFKLTFFQQPGHLWRVSVAPMSDSIGKNLDQLVDWGGAQRWLKSNEPADTIRVRATRLGGHAECYSQVQTISTYHPLEENSLTLHQRLKAALDPAGILNPGRMYPGL